MTMRHRHVIAVLVLAAACGGETPPSAEGLAQAPDTTIKPVERQPLTEADLVDLDRSELSIEIPWTRNIVDRAPRPAAPRSLVESAVVTTHDGFDRTQFTFSMDAPFPGYRIELVDAGTAVRCGLPDEGHDEEGEPEGEEEEVQHAPELEGARMLVVRIHPGWTSEGRRVTIPTGTETYQLARVQEAGVVCSADDVATWVAGLTEGTDVRVLEFRDPHRLVVDVR